MTPLKTGKSTLTVGEAAIVATICFGLFVLWSVQAVIAGFPDPEMTDAGNGWLIGLELVLGASALLYLRARGFDIASLYPHPTLRGTLLGVALFGLCWLFGVIAMNAVHTPGRHEVVAFSYSRMSLASTIALALVNGSFEEVFLLGVLVRGLRGFGLSVALGLPLLVRLLYHLYQGPLGVVWVGTIGITLSMAYVAGRQLWPAVFAHVLWDIVPTL
ncbi:CPBP family intramembrane glutamic endopeptidase [Aquabacterium sp.]|uniref:CPBP family intramembrane glutamic endopeptidase n=1 Tax=Aquabacterium sp. TaxID=1872578 RepID=UPI0037849860